MNRNQRIALAEKDLQVKELSYLLNKHPVHVSNVLSGRSKAPRLRRAICDILEKAEEQLWPESEKTF